MLVNRKSTKYFYCYYLVGFVSQNLYEASVEAGKAYPIYTMYMIFKLFFFSNNNVNKKGPFFIVLLFVYDSSKHRRNYLE